MNQQYLIIIRLDIKDKNKKRKEIYKMLIYLKITQNKAFMKMIFLKNLEILMKWFKNILLLG